MDAPPPLLAKWIWTDADFDQMGWHDNCLHAFGYEEQGDENTHGVDLLFDIDYIVSWVSEGESFRWWISPATLAFHDVWSLEVEMAQGYHITSQLIIEDAIVRESLSPGGGGWRWSVGPFGFWASGFTQYIRRWPILADRQVLTLEERGGLSLARETPRPLQQDM
jgi:hypothetical protein